MNVTGSQSDVLARLMDVASLRHKVIANNVANVNTPGYRERDVTFEDALRRQLDRGVPAAVATERVLPKIAEGAGGAERTDGNNVDIDQEMSALTKNTLLYRVFAQVLTAQIGQMRSAITGR
jgi:flagellar basal-body rod protein FlgB